MKVLADEADDFWRPLVAATVCSPEKYHLASVPALLEVGTLFKRLIVAVLCWPWRLALLCADPEHVTDLEKRSVVQMLVDACEGCLDYFSLGAKERCPTVEAALSPASV